MKNSRTNSFRLHRISRANSLKKQSTTFYLPSDETIKFSAMHSVTRGVRNNAVSFITGDDLNKLRVQPLQPNDNFYQAAHLSLAETRKRYDQVKKQRTSADQNITRLKAQIKKYKIVENQYQQKIKQGKVSVTNMQNDLQAKKILLQQTSMQKRVLLHMRKRLKTDKVVYDQRKFDFEKEESFQKKQISVLKRDGYFVGQQSGRTQRIYQKLLNQLNAQNIQRQQHLRNLQIMVEQKQKSNQFNITRGQQIYQIAERALQDRDPTQKQWNQIYLTHVFVSKMLRNKIDRQMEKFSIVEFAFKNIKTATGINDSKTLINKFLNKQAEYGDLLGKITANQKQISQLKQQRDRLLQEQKQLQVEKETLQNVRIKSLDISNQLKNFSVISDQERRMQTHLSKIAGWLSKQAKKLNSIEKSVLHFKQSKNKQNVKANFLQFCEVLKGVFAKCQKIEPQDAVTPSQLSARDTARVSRIQPRKSRKNSVGQQIFDVQQQELPPSNQYEQKQVINSQREELVKTNQKFMKEARKRLQERRKLNIQKVVEKKDKKVAEVKKQQD